MKKIFVCFALLLATGSIAAQSVKQEGKTFVQMPKTSTDSVKTEYVYKDIKGKKYVVYLSSKGKAYIRISEKAGAKGRKYMPEIGKQINPQAYKEGK